VFPHRPIGAAVAAVAILLVSGNFARAGFLSVAGAGNILNPSTTPTGATADFFNDAPTNNLVHGWNEVQNFRLDRDLYVDATHMGYYHSNADLGGFHQFKINQGTIISSQMLYYDPAKQTTVAHVTFTFNAPILGVIVESDRFHNTAHGKTDSLLASDFLGNPLTTYPTRHFEDRGLELDGRDRFVISATGYSITLNLTANTPGDQIRVITGQTPGNLRFVPAPPGAVLAAIGLASIGLGRLLRRKRHSESQSLSA
jgi:hypothetical protein